MTSNLGTYLNPQIKGILHLLWPYIGLNLALKVPLKTELETKRHKLKSALYWPYIGLINGPQSALVWLRTDGGPMMVIIVCTHHYWGAGIMMECLQPKLAFKLQHYHSAPFGTKSAPKVHQTCTIFALLLVHPLAPNMHQKCTIWRWMVHFFLCTKSAPFGTISPHRRRPCKYTWDYASTLGLFELNKSKP